KVSRRLKEERIGVGGVGNNLSLAVLVFAAPQAFAQRRGPQMAGWYLGNMTVNETKEKLKEAPEGTFLIRDSSHSDYLLTISVKTSAGPTNLQIEYQDGQFRLDSILCVKPKLEQFDSVDKWTGTEAPWNALFTFLYLTKQLYTSAPPLQHLCRLTINKCTGTVWGLPLPTRLKDYLEEYKFQV
uniref:Suppressor of cytokine signaling 2 n=1 Tax=Canis lupus familiaris TaxID=9615 RepID=A0A8P0P1A0_CANLF